MGDNKMVMFAFDFMGPGHLSAGGEHLRTYIEGIGELNQRFI